MGRPVCVIFLNKIVVFDDKTKIRDGKKILANGVLMLGKNRQDAVPGVERRSSERDPAFLGAVLSTDAGRFPCIVRSFCMGGIYAVFTDGIRHDLKANTSVDLQCSIPSTSGTQSLLQFQAQVVRVDTHSVGLSFVNPNMERLTLLQQAVKQARHKAEQMQRNKKAKPTGIDQRAITSNRQSLIIRCNSICNEFAPKIIRQFLKSIDTELRQLAQVKRDVAVQNLYLEGRDELARVQSKVSQEFTALIRGDLAGFKPTKVAKASGELTLTLMEQTVFDNWLADTVVVDKIEENNRKALVDLEQRLSVLWAVEIDKDSNPYRPGFWLGIFRDIIKGLGLSKEVNSVCNKAFEQLLLSELGHLYSSLNNFLIKQKVLPVIEHKVKVVKAKIPFVDLEESRESIEHNVHEHAALEIKRESTLEPSAKNSANTTEKNADTTTGKTTAKTITTKNSEIQTVKEIPVGKDAAVKLEVVDRNTAPEGSNVATDTGTAEADIDREKERGRAISDSGLYFLISRLYGLQHELGLSQDNRWFSFQQSTDGMVQRSELCSVLRAHAAEEPLEKSALNLEDWVVQGLERGVEKGLNNWQAKEAKRIKIGAREASIIRFSSRLFSALTLDYRISEMARLWIRRLQLPVLTLTLEDEAALFSGSHIVRKVLQGLSCLELSIQAGDAEYNNRLVALQDCLETLVSGTGDRNSAFVKTDEALSQLLPMQKKIYRENLDSVVRACIKTGESSTAKLNPKTHAKAKKIINRLKGGEWFHFQLTPDTAMRLRLAWYPENMSYFVFITPMGVKNRTLSVLDLAQRLDSGEVSVSAHFVKSPVETVLLELLQGMHTELLRTTTHDMLTGLLNRQAFEKVLEQALDQVKCQDKKFVFCHIEFDNFKSINDQCGYSGGDKLLKQAAEKLQEFLGNRGVTARLSGTEFAVLLENCSVEEALDLGESQIRAFSSHRFHWKNKEYRISVSMGMVPVSKAWENAEGLMKAAGSSCALARNMGGGRLQLYHSGHSKQAQHSQMLQWISELEDALKNDRLGLRVQRIQPTGSDTAKRRYEVLLTASDSKGNDLSVHKFIKAAEWYNKISQIDRWVIKSAMQWMVQHTELLSNIDSLSLNLSAMSLNDEDLVAFVEEQMLTTGVNPRQVCFEITELAGIQPLSEAAEFIDRIRQTGCKFALDDFGAGSSSYAYLSQLPIDYFKVDAGFIKEFTRNKNSYAVVKSICEIGRYLGKNVVAECVEDENTMEMLIQAGVDYIQGYAVEKPISLTDLTDNGNFPK